MDCGRACWNYVGDAVEVIEKNLKAPLTLRGISRDVGLSEYHLHRIFKAMTGHSLMAYVRGRKLSASLHDLLDTRMKIIDIACEYGFRYEQTFERAFRQQFRFSPSAVRKMRPDLPIMPVPDVTGLNDMEQGMLFNPAFIMKPRFTLAGIETEVVHAENNRDLTANKLGQDFFFNRAAEIPGRKDNHVYYGFVRYAADPAYSNYYMPSVEVSLASEPPPGFTRRKLPTHLYAMFRYAGFHDPRELTIHTLKNIYGFVFTWLPASRYRQAAAYHFERIDMRRCGADYCEADIYVPVETNNSFQ